VEALALLDGSIVRDSRLDGGEIVPAAGVDSGAGRPLRAGDVRVAMAERCGQRATVCGCVAHGAAGGRRADDGELFLYTTELTLGALACAICLRVLNNPHMIRVCTTGYDISLITDISLIFGAVRFAMKADMQSNCSHLFCRSCLLAWLSTRRQVGHSPNLAPALPSLPRPCGWH
jgi:hypothetical protein